MQEDDILIDVASSKRPQKKDSSPGGIAYAKLSVRNGETTRAVVTR
jgi:hypothetical protein